MLDQDSVLDPELAAKAVKVEGAIRHLSQDDMESYANGRLASARLSYCSTHLDACEACRAELEDIRTLQTELASFPRRDAGRLESGRRGRRRSLSVPVTASVAVVLVAGVGAVLWWRHAGSRGVGAVAAARVAPVAMPTANSAGSVPRASSAALAAPAVPVASAPRATSTPAAATSVQTHDTQLADELAALPSDLRASVSDAIQQGRLQLPPDVRRVHDRTVAFSQPAESNTGFSLSGPFGEATSDARPKFTWQPLAGAIGYTVAIVDQGLRPVQHSPALRATTWRPRRPLAHGRTYLWQVTATLRGGSKVVASSPSPSEATLRILPRKLTEQFAHFQRSHRDAHLVLGILYSQAGMVTEGTNELGRVPPGDPSSEVARRLLQSLSSRPGTMASR
jgi:hypothetical protein